MALSSILEVFTTTGPTVALVIVLLYWIFLLQGRLMGIIEKNTEAFTKTAQALDSMKETLDRRIP